MFAELYPHDPLTRARYEDLRNDLNDHPRSNAWTWPEVVALGVNAVSAEDLPVVLMRIHGALVAADAELYQPGFLTAVSRRLRSDPDALAAILRSAEFRAEIRCDTDFLAGRELWVHYEADDLAYWRSYFFARLLDGCRLFGDSSKALFRRRLVFPGPSLVVHDPVLFEERLLNVALLDLLLPYEPAAL